MSVDITTLDKRIIDIIREQFEKREKTSLRDLVAIAALPAIITSIADDWEQAAEHAYQIADAMLKEREKQNEKD